MVGAMTSPWRQAHLPEIARTLAGRPGHAKLLTLVAEILRNAFGAGWVDMDHEVRMLEVRGRAGLPVVEATETPCCN
jgi:hypothetical protein